MQSSQPPSCPRRFHRSRNRALVTRAEVRGELVQVEKAGYSPVAEDASYPAKTAGSRNARRRCARRSGAGGRIWFVDGRGFAIRPCKQTGRPAGCVLRAVKHFWIASDSPA
ncbi:DUF4148 domain-containing protein [Caballeronia sp. INDeC2]|uniref:DUF4148 domain-containing protein n=1 Tax=Caballeronia sp. INDeC2 TaxID=2921747 RepID=UPI002027E757|nr:DUF4148 domain-containing protein [Caballeronia sp. INDeC2]